MGGGAGCEGGAVNGQGECHSAIACHMPGLDAPDATLEGGGGSLVGPATFCDLLCAVVLGYSPEGCRGTQSEQARSPG